ncbi:hypothetical protein OG2516_12426 [Oceanicola granulosus HTCC2516]|uniref:EamA domain-containing protein n=1 Tax=Oceanicola granulosus (strain ATCC BAA-861 / DSM 15982 / KCTC 12143 / HTCC2516) TaxID=314256 RepID=Q2CAK2_OCEGH|nr:DMT family transporter [Oceanicola granulosus]EAR49711.1 hypothetical protein OG2516_12426 [Oceanicola granulosus HTCC2516]
MTSLGFLLVFAAAVSHATWNFLVKRINAGPELVWLFAALSVPIYLPAALWFGWTWRPSGAVDWLFLVGTAVLHLGYFLLLQAGYRRGDLSLVYPTARATGPVLSSTAAVLLLGELWTWQAAAGGGVIVFGVLMLTSRRRAGGGSAATSLAFGLGVGTLIGAYTIWDAYAVSALLIPPLLVDYASAVGRTVLLAPLAWRRRLSVRRLWAEHKAAVLAIAVLNSLGYILVLYAMTFTPVVYVAPLRETSVLLSVLAGSLLLGEGHLRHRLGWACVILAGVALLATG